MRNSFILVPFQKNALVDDLKINGVIERYSNALLINYEVVGKLSDIILPQKSKIPTRRNNLWEDTCYEFFIAIRDLPQYWEFNLSPSENWNIYYFKNYREEMREELTFNSLPFEIQNQPESFELKLECSLNKIVDKDQPLEIAISSVIKHKNSELSYWALTHCEPVADFHSRDSFVLQLSR